MKPKGPEQESEEETKSDEGPALIQMDEVHRRMEENEEFQKTIDWVSEGSEEEVQEKVQSYLAKIRMSWMNKEIFEHLEGGVLRAVEARLKRKGRRTKATAAGGARADPKTGARQEGALRSTGTFGGDASGKHR